MITRRSFTALLGILPGAPMFVKAAQAEGLAKEVNLLPEELRYGPPVSIEEPDVLKYSGKITDFLARAVQQKAQKRGNMHWTKRRSLSPVFTDYMLRKYDREENELYRLFNTTDNDARARVISLIEGYLK